MDILFLMEVASLTNLRCLRLYCVISFWWVKPRHSLKSILHTYQFYYTQCYVRQRPLQKFDQGPLIYIIVHRLNEIGTAAFLGRPLIIDRHRDCSVPTILLLDLLSCHVIRVMTSKVNNNSKNTVFLPVRVNHNIIFGSKWLDACDKSIKLVLFSTFSK